MSNKYNVVQMTIAVAMVVFVASACQGNPGFAVTSNPPSGSGSIKHVLPEPGSQLSLSMSKWTVDWAWRTSVTGDVCVDVVLIDQVGDSSKSLVWSELQLNNQVVTVNPTHLELIADIPVDDVICWHGILQSGKYNAKFQFLFLQELITKQYSWSFEVTP